jgi:hypothetical protein
MKYVDWVFSSESISLTIYSVILFFILTPGILVRLPLGGSKITVALTHAVIYGLVWFFTSHYVWQMFH